METHIYYCIVGTICTGVAIYAAATGTTPLGAALAGAVAFFCLYPSTPN